MNIRFSCSSFLPPNNLGWKTLQKNNKLIFGEFGDWPIALTKKVYEDIFVWVIVIEDIISEKILMSSKKVDLDSGIKIIDSALDILLSRLKQNTHTIVVWTSENANSLIRYSKIKPNSKLLFEYFENNLYGFTNNYNKLFLIPLDKIFAIHGNKNCFDSRNFYMTRIRFSQFGIKLISESIVSILSRISRPSSKVLVLDCDNTIWGGVVGESGLSNILIGQDGIGKAFTAFQKSIKELSNNGLILCISSKNEEKDVINVLKNHNSMILNYEDFTIIKSNWTEKYINVKDISEEIGVGLDSIVFWDDNPIEREKIKINLPDVKVIEPPAEIVEWPSLIKSLDYFADFKKTKEDYAKVTQYKAKAKFEGNKNKSNNNFEFLESVNMKINFLKINESNISRAAQLCKKTNQMNLRLIRHDEDSITNFSKKEKTIKFLVQMQDKFGDHGIVSLVMVKEHDDKSSAFLDTFLMSCRVLGREMESMIFIKLKEDLLKKGFNKLYAEFINGDRNTPAKKLLDKLNFNVDRHKKGVTNYSIRIENWEINNSKEIKKIYKL